MKSYRTTRPGWKAAFWLGSLMTVLPVAGNAWAEGHRHSTATPTPDTAPDVITVQQSTIDFGDQRVGRSTTENLELRNDTGEPLTLTLTQTGSTDFSLVSKCPTTIKPHKECKVKVKFQPSATGSLTGTLTIDSGDADGDADGEVAVALSGLGTSSGSTPTPKHSPTPTATATSTVVATATPTATETPEDSPTATRTPTATATPTITASATATATATESPEDTPTATEIETPEGSPSATTSATATATPSPTSTATPTANTCVPSSSLSVLVQGGNVDAYVPNGSWSETGLNVQLVPIEGLHTKATVVTAQPVHSCSSNETTGQSVCVANNTDVYLINGSSVTNTLTSGATGTANFSGGTCQNCGIVIDSNSNRAFITEGTLSGLGAYQTLDLATNTFSAPVTSPSGISEDIAYDPNRDLILSPNELGTYELITGATGAIYDNPTGTVELDSAAEDCTTGIALSSVEFTGDLFLADLSQATYVAGAPGSWSAPSQFQVFPEFAPLAAGTSGLAVAPGSHLAVMTGEFGSGLADPANGIAALQLPATSGSGTPAVVDYALAVMPTEPSGAIFTVGLDPHPVTAYVSPANSKAYGVVADDSTPRGYLAVVDLQALLSAPRTAGTHNVDPSVDLVATGVLRWVPIF